MRHGTDETRTVESGTDKTCGIDETREWWRHGTKLMLYAGAVWLHSNNKVFPASQTQDAFRYMQKGQHIGKITISIPHATREADTFETTKRALPIVFRSSASYLLVGGLGGLGRAISTWMVDRGARELLFLSRSAGVSSKHDTFVNELESMGCAVKLVQGDVTKLEDVERAVAEATHPLKGVIQMSMVLRDQNFSKMAFHEWTAATMPKVHGTWNLHKATVSAAASMNSTDLGSSHSTTLTCL